MSIDNIKEKLPEYAKDLKLNLSTLARSTDFPEERLWGTFLATAAATKSDYLLKEIADTAKDKMSETAFSAALGAASIMAMNNVFYSARGELPGYENLPAGLRMNIMANSGVTKEDFETWCLAVSAINHCKFCLVAHEHTLSDANLSKESIFLVIRIASVMSGIAQALFITDVLD